MKLGIFGSRILNRYDDYKRIREEILKINEMENCVKAKNVDLLDVEFKDLDL